MNHYLLLEGALVLAHLQGVSGFKKPQDWYATLLTGEARLAGPVLLSHQCLARAGQDAQKTFSSWLAAYPCGLHASLLDSPLELDDLAQHLRQHLRVITDDGSSFALRFADCRVLATLPGVLTPAQWQQLSGPLVEWTIHGRDGKPLKLPVDRTPHPAPDEAGLLHLSAAQVERLIDLSEPDAVLAALNRTPEQLPRSTIAWAHKAASYCHALWRQAGHTSRDVLHTLTRRALDSDGQLFDRPEEISRILGVAR